MAKESCDSINLQQKKLKVMSLISGIAKKGKNTHQSYNYIAVDDVINAFRTAFIKAGIAFHSEILKWHQIGSALLIEVQMTLINADNPTDKEGFLQIGLSTRLDDTSVGKALAYAVKNGLLKLFLIPGGRGEDVEHYDNKPAEKNYKSAFVEAPAPVSDDDVSIIVEELNEAEDLTELKELWGSIKETYARAACKKAYPIYMKLKGELTAEK